MEILSRGGDGNMDGSGIECSLCDARKIRGLVDRVEDLVAEFVRFALHE